MRTATKYAVGACSTVVVAAAAAYYMLFQFGAAAPPLPALSAAIQSASLSVDGQQRRFSYFAPQTIARAPGLVLVYHGARGTSEQIRRQTAYEFDRSADESGSIVVYPQGYEEHWNTCQRGRTEAATRLDIDDVAFTRALISWFAARYPIDRSRVFAVGFSNGGHMAYRLALELPDEVAAVAAVSALLPDAEDFKCQRHATPAPVLIVHGTRDPISPYGGGELSFYGLRDLGPVRSADATAAFFARGAGEPRTTRLPETDGDDATWVEQTAWGAASRPSATLITIHGGGHSIAQPSYVFPRVFGATSTEVDAPAEIWRFFEETHPQ